MIAKIPIDEAIQARSWLTCENDDCRLKIRLDAMREMETDAVAALARRRGKDVQQAKAVILSMTIINACNTMLVNQVFERMLRIIDHRGLDYCSVVTEEDREAVGIDASDEKVLLKPEELAQRKLTFMLPALAKEYYFGMVEGHIQEE